MLRHLRRCAFAGVSLLIATLAHGQTLAQSQTASPAIAPAKAIVLTDQQVSDWIGKPVFGGEGKRVGEVASFIRDSSGNVSGMLASFGGFLGFAKTSTRLSANDFALTDGNVILYITAAEAKALPVGP